MAKRKVQELRAEIGRLQAALSKAEDDRRYIEEKWHEAELRIDSLRNALDEEKRRRSYDHGLVQALVADRDALRREVGRLTVRNKSL